MRDELFNRLLTFLGDLEQGNITYSLAHHRDNALMVIAVVPGERWEIEFLDDGSIEIERFISDGEIYGAEALDELFAKYSDQASDNLESPQSVELMAVSD